MSKINSTIFKTITSSVDESRKTLALFNKDWNTYKTNWQNANGIGGKIGSIFASANAGSSTSVISNDQVQILRNWNSAVKHGCTDQATFNRIIANADENTKMYFAGLNKGKGSIEGLKNAQKVATQSTIGLTIAQTALNMAITMGITALASLIMKGYDELANSVENCKERVDDLMSSYKSVLDTANNNANRVEELADKYEDLSNGVNNLGENVSLTNEEYQEYNSLVNEIADMFPTLVQGYTDEGNAILNLKGNVEQLRDAYKEAQQEAYNLLIVSGEDSDGNDIIKQWEDTHDTGFWSDMLDFGADDVGGSISVSDALEQLRAIQQMSADEYREIERITSSGSRKEIAGLTDIEKEIGYGSYLYKALGLNSNSTDEEFREAQRQAKALIQTYNAEIESALSDVETLANAYLMTNEDYDKLDAQSKSAASMIVNNLNADIANGFSSKEDVATYVDGIVQAILSNDKAEGALTDLFTMDTSDMSISEIESQVDSYINTIADALNEDPIELKTRLGFDNSDTEPLVNKVKGFLSDEFDNKVGELTLDELDIASEFQIPEGTLLTWDELIAKIREVQGSTSDNETTGSFSSIFNSSDFSEQKQSLLELAKAGELTNKALSSDDYSDFIDKLEEIGISAEEAKTEILSLLDATEKLSGASKSISGLENAYEEFKENGYVLAETIESIPEVFQNLETYDFDVFKSIVGNPKNANETIKEGAKEGVNVIQAAFDDLVTAYISEMAVLSNMSESESQQFIANLKEMGVVNAEEVVNSVLALNDSMKATAKEAESTAQEINEFLVNVKGKAASATNDLTNCTWSEIQALIEEGNKFGYTTSKIEEFAMQKIWANRNSINTSDDIAQLLAVAKAAGFAATSISAYENAVKMQNQGYGGGEAWVKSMQESAWRDVLREIEESFNFTPTVSYKAPTTSSSSSSSSSTSSSKEAEKTVETFDWIEKLIERIQSRIAKLEKTASSTYKSWAERNKALLKQLSEVNTEINAQQKAYDTYMAKANSVGLSEHYKQLVQNGGYSIEDITDDTLKNKISEYEEWYNKAMDCSDAIDDLKNNILELTTTQFENVFNEYEDSLSGYRHQIEMLETYIDQTEAKGYVVSGNYYKQLIETEKLNIKMLQDEYAKLKDSLQLSVDTGKIVAYSDAWYDMVDNIRNVQKSIEDANTSLIDYQTTLRELEWESFDRFMDKISSIKDESDFLIELMSDKDMFNEDGITDEGQATLGLHAINYNVYLSKAEEYAKKLKDINEEIANDPNNQTLLERRQELLELQQESILASKDEQQAMKDLISEGYDTFLDTLQELIDKQKELLDSQKSLHDYEKSISKKTNNISNIKKQLEAYKGDTSESAKATIQKLEVSLREAEEDLEETEYDKYISDQQDMLDELYDNAEEWVNERLDNLSQLVSEVIDSTNENASDINSTIKESADDVGYTISNKLSNALTSASNGVADLVSDYNDNFLETMTTLQSTVNDIRRLIEGESNSDNLENGDKYNSDEEKYSSPQDRWTKDENNNWNYYENGNQVKDSWTKYEKDDKWYHLDSNGNMSTNTWIKNKSGTWSYVDGTGAAVTSWHKLDWQGSKDWYSFDNEGNMHENQWIDDYFVGKDGKMLTNTWIGHNGKYYWVGADGKWLDKPGWSLDYKPNDGLPLYEYAKGSKKIPEDQLAWTQEEGTEIIRRASDGALLTPLGQDDMVFTNEASRKLWEFSQDPEGYMAKLGLSGLKPVEFAMPSISSMTKMPKIQRVAPNQNVNIQLGDIQMYGVNDPQEFAKQLRNTLSTDTKTQKLLTEKIGSSFLGRTDRSNFYR